MRPSRVLGAVLGALAAAVSAAGWVLPNPEIPVSLDDAIRYALERNLSIKVEAFEPSIARANVLAAYGQFDPSLTFDRSYSRGYTYPNFPQPLPSELYLDDQYDLALKGALPLGTTYSLGGSAENVRGPFNNYTNNFASFAGVNVTQPLLKGFGFGANLVGLRVAKANRGISDWQFRETLIETVTSVVEEYSSLVLAHDNLHIAQSSSDLANTLLSENQHRLQAGQKSESDVTQARAQVAQRQEAILEAEYSVRNADNQLRELMGQTSFPPDEALLKVAPPELPPIEVQAARDYQYALANRPDYQAARLGISIDRANDSAARNSLLPQVNLVASYGYNGLSQDFAASRRMAATEDFPSSSIGVAFSIPITNALGRGQARAARLQRREDEENLHLLEANIAVAVSSAGTQIGITAQRVTADRQAEDLAKQALADEEKKLATGSPDASTSTVIQAQQTLISVEDSLASAQAAQRTAAALYEEDTGFILARYHIDLAAEAGH